MAGEWLAIDIGLPDKPEVQELIDLTDEPVEVVVYRLYRLWSWASMHCADGVAKMTTPRLCRVCGGDLGFWEAVAAVGWLEIDETAATVSVPGWDRRFSQAAKSRFQARDREKAYEEKSGRPSMRERGRHPAPTRGYEPAPARGRGEEIRGEYPPPPPRDAVGGWEELRTAWNKGPGRKWTPQKPPEGTQERLAEDGWLESAVAAIGRLRACKYFEKPVTLIQFVKPGFVDKVLGEQFDDPKPAGKQSGRQAYGEERQPPRVDPAFEAARAATEAREAAKRLAEHKRLDSLAVVGE